jgi:hypothetical protein
MMMENMEGEIALHFSEDEDHTDARAVLTLRGATFTGWGRARRNPADPSVPMVGEELATARALSDLAHKLLDGAAEGISDFSGRPAHLVI